MAAPFVVSMKFVADAASATAASNEVIGDIDRITEAAASARSAPGLQSQIDGMFGLGGGAALGQTEEDIAAFGAQLDALRAKFNPLFAIEQKHVAALAEIDAASKVGAIDADETAAAIATETAAYEASIAALDGSSVALEGHAAASGHVSGEAMAAQHAVRSMVEQLALGVSPAQALTMQLGHLSYAAAGEGGLVGSFRSVGDALAPLLSGENLIALGLAGAVVAASALWSAFSGGGEQAAEAALKAQKQLIDELTAAYPALGTALKAALDQGKELTPNEIVLQTSQQIDAAKNEIASLKQSFNDFYQLASAPVGQGGSGALGGLDAATAAQIRAIVDGLNDGTESASKLKDDLAGLSMRSDLPTRVQDLITEFYNLATQIADATTQAQAFATMLDAARAQGGLVIGGDFSQLGGDTQKAYDALKSVIDSGVSEKAKLEQLVKTGVAGATSPQDAQNLQNMLAQAEHVLDQKAADSSQSKTESSIDRVTASLQREIDAYSESGEQQAEQKALAEAGITTNDKAAASIIALADKNYELAEAQKAEAAESKEAAEAQQRLKEQIEDVANDAFSVLDQDLEAGKGLFASLADAAATAFQDIANAFFKSGIDNLVSSMFGGTSSGSSSSGGWLSSLINGALGLFGGGNTSALAPGAGLAWAGLGHNASGTNYWRGGPTSVNEAGGEILNLPDGTQIIPHDVSMEMAASAGSSGMSFAPSTSIVITGSGVTMADVQAALDQRDAQIWQQFPAAHAAANKHPRRR
jgi:hypothetical protein